MNVNRLVGNGWRVGVLASVTAAVAALGGAGVGTSAVAATPHVSAIEISSGVAKVVSSTGHKLEVEVGAYVAPDQPSADEADVTITRETADGEEIHTWMFPVKASHLTVNALGKGTLRLAAGEIGRFGALDLTMTPKTDPTTQKCGGKAAATTTRVKLAGNFFFNAHSSGATRWGTVGFKNAQKTFAFHGKNTVTRVFASGAKCLDGTQADDTALPCVSTMAWDASTPTVDLNGVELFGVDLMAASRMSRLASPVGTMRLDAVFGSVPAPKLTTSPDPVNPSQVDAQLVTVGHGSSTGSASITSASGATTTTLPCGAGSKTVDATAWPHSTYDNGATPFAMKAQVFGDIDAPNSATAMLMKVDPTKVTPTPTPTPTPTATETASPAATAHIAAVSNRTAAIAAAKRYLIARATRHVG